MATSNYTQLFSHATDFKPFSAGTVIFEEGSAGDCLYVVKSGTVSLKHGTFELESLGEGALFGEMALLDGEKRSATALAASDCELVPVDQKRFRYLVQQHPYFAQHVMKIMADRLRRLTKQLG
jgi:CRP-like cAMP-binding protein